MKHNVIIVDDHLLFARGLAGLINTFDEYEVLFTLKNGAELVDKFGSGMVIPGIILLDVNMPIMDGVSTMKWLKKYKPEAKVIAISMEDDEETILNMIRNGAKGYLLKDTEPVLLKQALDTVLEKGYFHTELVTNSLMHALDSDDEDIKIVEFNEKELEFVKLACKENTYKEIAEIMCLSPKTIDNYRQNVFDKIGVRNRIGMVIYAIKNKIINI